MSISFGSLPCLGELDEDDSLIEELELVGKDCPNMFQTYELYRVTDPEQSCDEGGLIAKDPTAKKTPLSHVNCGGRTNYRSQFISFTTSIDIIDKYWAKKPAGAHVVKVKVGDIPKYCKIYDLTSAVNRNKWLGKVVCAKYAAYDCEVLLWCKAPIPCTTIRGPKMLMKAKRNFN